MNPDRRALLRHAGITGLLIGAPARLTFGAAARPDSDPATAARLVVVLLRGALDGLAAVPAPGDPAWAALRPRDGREAARQSEPLPLDGFFALHAQLSGLHRWWQDGSLLIAHAVAQPYRERSHFDAQQLLESGGGRPFELHTGWLGRALAQSGQPGLALAPQLPLAMRGSEQAGSWAPGTRGARARSATDEDEREMAPTPGERPSDLDLHERVQRLYAAEPRLAAPWARALEQQHLVMGGMTPGSRTGEAAGSPRNGTFVTLARQAGRFLAAPAGPRLAWLELGGWDTHSNQAARLEAPLAIFDAGLVALREALGASWATTLVLVMTEFGRTAAFNGSAGTDHGTAGMALLAGGRVRGGRVRADWPGLARGQLHEGRDLRPSSDLRGLQRAVLEATWALPRTALEEIVLPGAPPAWPDLLKHPT